MIKVKVPATSANLGPGFDTLGLAFNMYNSYTFEEIQNGLEITGCESDFANEDNMVYTSMKKVFEKTGYEPKGIRIHLDSSIPISRGLGSSAACILGGVIGANELSGGILSQEELLYIATEIEGHPDNIAPALFGGLVVSSMEDEKVLYNQINIADGIKFIALIPDFKLSTSEARGVLPKEVSYKDAIYNVSRVSLLLTALNNGRFDLLKYALQDVLHQPYRGKLIRGFDEIMEKSQELGALGMFLSGAGPTMMAIVAEDDIKFTAKIKEYLESAGHTWTIKELEVDSLGAAVER